MQFQFLVAQGQSHFAFQAQMFLGPAVHVFAVKQESRFDGLARLGHGHVGKTEQCRRFQAVFRIHGDADAGAHVQRVRIDIDRCLEQVEQLLRHIRRVFALFDMQQGHDELAVVDARQDVRVAQGATEQLADGDHQLVAHFMAQGVADGTDAADVDDHQRAMRALPLRFGQALVDQLVQQAAVGQARQAVVVGHALHARFRILVHRDIGKQGKHMADFAEFVAHDADGDVLRKQFAILALADDFATPGTVSPHGGAHLGAEVGVVHARAQQVRRAADGFGRRIAGDAGKRTVDRDDALFRIRDQHGLLAVFDDARVQFDLVHVGQWLAHGRQAHGHAAGLARLVVDHVAVHAQPRDHARLLAPAHVGGHVALGEMQLQHARFRVVFRIQEQDVLAQRFQFGIAEHLFGAMVPADQKAVGIDFQQGVGRRHAHHGPAGAAQPLQFLFQPRQGGGLLRPRLLTGILGQAQAQRDLRLKHGNPTCGPGQEKVSGALRCV